MLRPLIRRPGRNAEPRSKERGFTMALVAISMVMIISMAALSIDIGTLYEAKAEAQRAADAAALTAARVVSISGITGDPGNTANSWQPACGGSTSLATLAATKVAQSQQNFVEGIASGTVTVTYGAGSAPPASTTCVGIANFAVNPVVTVTVQRTNLPVFFARIFSLFGSRYTGTTVSATATAEAFNPSGLNPMVPVQPRCVKPWMVPNKDPRNTPNNFVSPTTGVMKHPGISPAGDIGETFDLVTDCASAHRRRCALNEIPTATATTLDYVPGEVANASIAVAANNTITACTGATRNDYAKAVAGCDQSTVYSCGTFQGNTVNLNVNPGPPTDDSEDGAECLINATGPGLGNGQDVLVPGTYPFQIQAGGNSALVAAGIVSSSQITNSPSVVSLPIYDSNATVLNTGSVGTNRVTVVGFLQVFINQVDTGAAGNINVTVMNVSGCGNSAGPQPVYGTSPVPVRLITPP
jgi:Flp pilus assembly protein TadG